MTRNGTSQVLQRPDDILIIEQPSYTILDLLRGAPGVPIRINRPDPYQWFDPERGRQ